MSGLEQAYYIIGIIFMSVMLILIAATFVVVLMIRSKINHIHDEIVEKLQFIGTLTNMSSGLMGKGGMALKAIQATLAGFAKAREKKAKRER